MMNCLVDRGEISGCSKSDLQPAIERGGYMFCALTRDTAAQGEKGDLGIGCLY